jgi:ketosteroid isomerase-like protein
VTSHEAETDADAVRTANESTVRRILELISAGSYDDVLGHIHDDLVFELPYGPDFLPDTFDKKTYGEMQTGTFKMFTQFKIEPHVFHRMLDPDALVVEYRSDAIVERTGKPYRNRYIGVFQFRDGKVIAWREFHNPEVATAALMG